MYELAAHCRVLYLNEREYWRNLVRPAFWKKKAAMQRSQPFAPPENLTVIDPGWRYPFFYGKGKLNEYFTNKLVADITKKNCKKGGLPIYAYVWHPNCLEYLEGLKPAKVIYHPYDKFAGFCNDQAAQEQIGRAEQELVQRADAVITPHAKIADALGHPNTHIISNAVFTPAFRDGEGGVQALMPEIFADIPTPRIGYIGAINQKIDFQLLLEIVTESPDWSFILMGPQVNNELWDNSEAYLALKQKRNMHFFDGVNYKDVARYMRWFDVGCMPYSMESWMAFCQSPLKLYQYWALGKPVVSTSLPNLPSDPGTISIAATCQEWVQAIEWELKHDCKQFREKRQQLAASNSWKNKAEEVCTILKTL